MRFWIMIFFVVFIAAIILFCVFIYTPLNFEREISYGATFSKPYAEQFGLDWKEVYLAILDDLKVKSLRIPAYWNLIEPEKDRYEFADLDWQVDEAEKRNAKIILAIGRRVPRWPECFVPEWARELEETKQQEEIFEMIKEIVTRYKDNEVIWAWQIENEPFFSFFGECPPTDEDFLKKEIRVVKSLDDSKFIIITESGELSSWLKAAKYSDLLGVSLYRVVWNKHWGYFHHFFPTYYYRFKEWLVEKFYGTQVFVSEMQAEPWGPRPNPSLSLEEQFRGYNINKFEESLEYVKRTSFDTIYFWGIEWWYWLKEEHGRNEFWYKGEKLFR